MRQGDGSDLLGPNNPRNAEIGIIYIEVQDTRQDILTAITTQDISGRKQVAIVLLDSGKVFHQPVDFDGLKNMRRQLQNAELVFIAPSGSSPAGFARQRLFLVYSTLESYQLALQHEDLPTGNRRSKSNPGLVKDPGIDAQTIYLSPEEELTSVRERLEKTQARKIILVIPLQTQLRSHVGWRLIHARMRELGIELQVICPDRQVRAVAHAAGFKVAESEESPSNRPRLGSIRAGQPEPTTRRRFTPSAASRPSAAGHPDYEAEVTLERSVQDQHEVNKSPASAPSTFVETPNNRYDQPQNFQISTTPSVRPSIPRVEDEEYEEDNNTAQSILRAARAANSGPGISGNAPTIPTSANLPPETVYYTNAKVVLVGESGVGKSGLALVLTGQPYAATESTHGRHIWQLDQREFKLAGLPRETQEIVLWDLAGQPDHRLIHPLHLHEASVALIVFDPARDADPFVPIRHWHYALKQARQVRGSAALPLTTFLVAARTDVSGRRINRVRMNEFARELGCAGYFETSARTGRGISELKQAIHVAINWAAQPTVTSTELLAHIKAFISSERQEGRILRPADELCEAFRHETASFGTSNDFPRQFQAALDSLAALGEIRRFGFGNLILLQPEWLDAYASGLLLAVKDESDGLGSIAETRVQHGQFFVPIEERLTNSMQEKLLLIAMIDELVSQQLVLRDGGFLLFPSQSTREHPNRTQLESQYVLIFSFSDPMLELYTTLVVRLAQSGVFQKQDLWQRVATYTTRLGGTYGLLLTLWEEGRAELGLFFDEKVREELRFLFEDFVSTHLERHTGGAVQRKRRFVCSNCNEAFADSQITKRQKRGYQDIYCSICNTRVSLLDNEERINLSSISQLREMELAVDVRRERESAVSILPGKIATRDFDVFLCHHGPDKTVVKQIGEKLKQQGILPWLDEWELRPGLPWQRLLEEQIGQIKAAAVFVGKSGLGPWQQQELDAFLREFARRGCPVIPVLLEDAPQEPKLPIFLQAITWVDFRVTDPDPLQRLVWGITGKRETLHR